MIDAIILFLSAMAGGSLVFFISKKRTKEMQMAITFSGAYLFSLTILHILPELYEDSHTDGHIVSLFILLGFFFQVLLEPLTSGVEHGHLDEHHSHKHHHPVTPLIIGMLIHATFDGAILSGNFLNHGHGQNNLMIGLVLHKIPAAFALVSVISQSLSSKKKVFTLLIIFALASPFGIFASNFLFQKMAVDHMYYNLLIAVVAGNFLHISTTIFFETSPEHQFNFRKMFITLLGVLLAIAVEFIL
ncbi:ZIP family metal transporter [Aureibacter tunicatorum]|uniref:Zinc transporter ZupT n=1 Tax=Aureibacter tunicatorum TaxID=866807 RepID=A0AAE3XMV4_9BACT|nr:ZIP family metal transporter [Aureibacter tunicatorum]MDR6238681.1 zinc transporter ZupT [Aureibacter tunicatorum]BDD05388.1 hypothetical protein AUTU_28710 [Aureibacter tunicatorum]